MKKSKLKLKNLEIESFTTSLNRDDAEAVKGGWFTENCTNGNICSAITWCGSCGCGNGNGNGNGEPHAAATRPIPVTTPTPTQT